MNLKSIAIFIAIMIGVLAGVGGLLWQFGQSADKPVADVAADKHLVRGSGAVTLVEFSDFQCPACQQYEAPLEQLMNKYEGKVELVYRYFPLISIHKNAMISAQAAEAAFNQGKFWEMHDKLFATQNSWKDLSDPKDTFVGYAKELGLDENKFKTDIDSQGVKDIINIDLLATTRYQLTGTPTFFLNGSKIEFTQIDEKLAELTK